MTLRQRALLGRERRGANGEAAAPARAPVALIGAGVFLLACSGSGPERPRVPAPRAAAQGTTTTSTLAPPDLSQVTLAPVPGRARAVVEVRPGGATLVGAVTGPDGPLGGAVIHAERLVGDASASTESVSGPDGRWAIPAIKGGRYRVRAWRPPDHALLEPAIFFLAGNETKELVLSLERLGGLIAVAAIAPNPPVVNQPANIAVRLAQRTVDERGFVQAAPLPGVQVELSGAGHWLVRSPNPVVTDLAGVARWQLVCTAPGNQPLSVLSPGSPLPVPVPVPGCR